MLGSDCQRLENQQVQCALRKINAVVHAALPFCFDRRLPRSPVEAQGGGQGFANEASSMSTLCLTDDIVALIDCTELVDLVTNGTLMPSMSRKSEKSTTWLMSPPSCGTLMMTTVLTSMNDPLSMNMRIGGPA